MWRKTLATTSALAFLLLCGTGTAIAQMVDAPAVTYPAIPHHADRATGFVPKNWTLIDHESGDLNGDGKTDLVILIRMTDRKNLVPLPYSTNGEIFDTNPYMLVVAFAEPESGFRLAASNHRLFHRPDVPFSGDAPPDSNTLRIDRGSLVVFFEYLRDHESFRFRWQDGNFALIGYDSGGASGSCVETISINFLTKVARWTNAPISRDGGAVSRIHGIKPVKLPNLQEFDMSDFIATDTIAGASPPCHP